MQFLNRKKFISFTSIFLSLFIILGQISYAQNEDEFDDEEETFKVTIEAVNEDGEKIENPTIRWYQYGDLLSPQPPLEDDSYTIKKDYLYVVKVSASNYDEVASKEFGDFEPSGYFNEEDVDDGVTVRIVLLSEAGKFKEYKKALKNELDNHVDINNYREEDKSTILDLISEGKDNIEITNTKQEANEALEEAKRRISEVPTIQDLNRAKKAKQIYFQYNDGSILEADDKASFTITDISEGRFKIKEYSGNSNWEARKQYQTESGMAWNIAISPVGALVAEKAMYDIPAKVTLTDKNNEVIEFKVNIVPSDITEIKAYIDGEEVSSDKTIIADGSTKKLAVIKGKLDNNWITIPLKSISFNPNYNIFVNYSNGEFHAINEGYGTLTYALKNKPDINTTINIRSNPIAVTGINVTVPKRWEINGWNQLGGYFTGVQRGNKATQYQIDIFPSNATNQRVIWTALTPEIAEHMEAFDNGIVPKKAGIARFKVSSEENPDIFKIVEVEFVYKKPLTSIIPKEELVVMRPNERKNLEFTVNPTNASEQRMYWTIDGKEQSRLAEISSGVSRDPGNVNAPKVTTHTIRTMKKGVIKVVGTPYDTTQGAKPVTFRVLISNNPDEILEEVKNFEDSIANIGDVTLESEEAISDARDNYDDLSSTAKKLTDKLEDLVNAEKKFEDLKSSTISKLREDVDNLNNITLEDKEKIDELSKLYEKVNDLFSEEVLSESLVAKLKSAKEKISELENQKARDDERKQELSKKASYVENLIDNITIQNIDYSSQNKLIEIKEKYDNLEYDAKVLVKNKEHLDKSINRFDFLVKNPSINFVNIVELNKGNHLQILENKIIYDKANSKEITLQLETEATNFYNNNWQKILINENILDNAFTIKENSSIITFHKEFLTSLPKGLHTLKIYSQKGYGIIDIEIIETIVDVPSGNSYHNESDNNNINNINNVKSNDVNNLDNKTKKINSNINIKAINNVQTGDNFLIINILISSLIISLLGLITHYYHTYKKLKKNI